MCYLPLCLFHHYVSSHIKYYLQIASYLNDWNTVIFVGTKIILLNTGYLHLKLLFQLEQQKHCTKLSPCKPTGMALSGWMQTLNQQSCLESTVIDVIAWSVENLTVYKEPVSAWWEWVASGRLDLRKGYSQLSNYWIFMVEKGLYTVRSSHVKPFYSTDNHSIQQQLFICVLKNH